MDSKVVDILRFARELVHRPELWCQRVSSRGFGKATARCASKAIADAAEVVHPDLRWAADGLLASAAGVDILVLWNDAWGRSHRDVLAVFDGAIAKAQQHQDLAATQHAARISAE